MSSLARFRLMLQVLPLVGVLAAAKLAAHHFGWEVVALDVLTPSLVAGAIFIIGFLLAHVLGDFKEAERLPGEMRAALEALDDDVAAFAQSHRNFELHHFRGVLLGFVEDLGTGLSTAHRHVDLATADRQLDRLAGQFRALELAGMSDRYIVRLRQLQDGLRRSLHRISYVQRMQNTPSVQVLVQTLAVSCLALLVLVRSSGTWQPALVVGLVGYLFIYALILIHKLEQPFRKGEHSVDDVSLFLLREFSEKLAVRMATDVATISHVRTVAGTAE